MMPKGFVMLFCQGFILYSIQLSAVQLFRGIISIFTGVSFGFG